MFHICRDLSPAGGSASGTPATLRTERSGADKNRPNNEKGDASR